MRIGLVIGSLLPGGAERVMSTMASYWAAQGHEVVLITLTSQSDDAFGVHPRVRRVGLGIWGASAGLMDAVRRTAQRVVRLRRAFRQERPDVIISFLEVSNVLSLIAGVGLGTPIVVSERIDPRHHPIGTMWNLLRKRMYRHAHGLVVQTESVRGWATTLVAPHRVHVVPNPANPVAYGGRSEVGRMQHRLVVGMGRLVKQKGFDLLIKAFAECAAKHSDWSLVILGEGHDRPALESLIREKELTGRVRLVGQIKDPLPFLLSGGLFVLPSRYEGFPNALVEAMSCGLPVIAADCPSGPRDIVREGIDGILIPPNDVAALAQAMEQLMSDEARQRRYGDRAREVTERFSLPRVMGLWEEVIEGAVGRRVNSQEVQALLRQKMA